MNKSTETLEPLTLELYVWGGFLLVVLAVVFGSCGCAALSSVTPADRATAYESEARGVATLCKAYRFDRSVGLVPDVPAMTELCDPVQP